jgi:hypothetical protein
VVLEQKKRALFFAGRSEENCERDRELEAVT